MPQDEKLVWFLKAEEEKVVHMLQYPDYRFTTRSRVKKLVKRNVKRNCEDEMRRCRLLADLLLAGKEDEPSMGPTIKANPNFTSNPRLGNTQVAPTTYLANPPTFSQSSPSTFISTGEYNLKGCLCAALEYQLVDKLGQGILPTSRQGDNIMSNAMPLTYAHSVEGNMQTSIPPSYSKSQYSLEPIHDPTSPKTLTYACSSISSTHTHHYDNAPHSYSSAYAQSPYPCQLTSPEAESNVQMLVISISRPSTRNRQCMLDLLVSGFTTLLILTPPLRNLTPFPAL